MAKDYRFANLKASIVMLAAPASEQSAYLTGLFRQIDGDDARFRPCDELALEFDDYWLPAQSLVDEGKLSSAQHAAIQRLSDYFDETVLELGFWRRESLFNDPRWQAIREIASEVLLALPAEETPTD